MAEKEEEVKSEDTSTNASTDSKNSTDSNTSNTSTNSDNSTTSNTSTTSNSGEEYKVGDYGIFSDGISTAKTLGAAAETSLNTLSTQMNKISDTSIFMGPICDSCVDGFTKASASITLLGQNMNEIANYLVDASTNYQSGDDNAKQKIISIDSSGKIVVGEHKTVSTGNTNQDYIYNYLASKGFNDAAISGIMANLEHESGFRTDAVGDNGTSYGICQWHNGRWDNLNSFCSQNGYDPSTLDGQLEFLLYELETGYSGVYDTLRSVPNTSQGAYDAAYKWTTDFEIPDNTQARANDRGNTAVDSYWPIYST